MDQVSRLECIIKESLDCRIEIEIYEIVNRVLVKARRMKATNKVKRKSVVCRAILLISDSSSDE